MSADVDAGPVAGASRLPSTPTERALAEVLAGVLKVEGVGVDQNFFDDLGADSMLMTRFCARVRKRGGLPTVAITDVYRNPTIRDLATALADTGPTRVEAALAEVLAEVLQAERVGVDQNFFDDLGADSMLMTRFCARVRKHAELPAISIKDVYQHPTISGLATTLAPVPVPAPLVPADPAARTAGPVAPAPDQAGRRAGRLEYVLCGALQLLIFLGYLYLGSLLTDRGYEWVAQGAGWLDMYLRAALFGGLGLLILSILPIVAKWTLIGRWRPEPIRIWSLAYVRFWIVKTLIRSNPLLLFAGERGQTSGCSPLYVLYLRSLGARIGRGVAIYSRTVPVCTDLLTIGDNTVVRKDCFFSGYSAHAGVIRPGRITLGKDVFVGEATHLDIETTMGDGAQLGHASALQAGQVVPAGERWHGVPAQRGGVDYRRVPTTELSSLRRFTYSAGQLATMLLFYVPLTVAGAGLLLAGVPALNRLLGGHDLELASWILYRDALIISAVFFFVPLLVGLLVIGTVPRLLNRFMEPDKVYRLYGWHYGIHRLIGRLTNGRLYPTLFGDSSYIVHYLRWIGYDLTTVEQTGSNFGTVMKHETPFLATIGRGTMVADALSIINADFSSTSFRLSRATIGAHNFLGNAIAYPAGARTGDNCLLGTKALVPVEGEVRTDVGLLGSPSFDIPRTVLRDSRLGPKSEAEFRERLHAKNMHNLRTMGLFLLVRWGNVFGLTVLAMVGANLYQRTGSEFVVQLELLLTVLFGFAYFTLMERGFLRFRRLQPQCCSIYDRYFWWHERFWKFAFTGPEKMLAGTPFKNVLSRLLGVRIGRMVFDDGVGTPERTLVTIGDYCTLNEDSHIQCHSQEDGAFKSDRSTLGAGCTLSVGSFVHYGVTMGDGAVLAAGAFLMKGEEVPAGAHWGGNPARELPPHELPSTTPAPLPAPATAALNGKITSGAVLNGAIPSGAVLNGAVLNGAVNGAVLNGTPVNAAAGNGAAKVRGRHRAPTGRHAAPSR
ncbi:Pls/PosA family non-ribosomal peptide synthetase [Geodermatophilus sp. URMC 64]